MIKFREKFSTKNIAKKVFQKASNEDGQVSIFLAILLIVIFTLLAFVVNVGLFVKAKINLQNALDSAAWSGAAAQSRQLTNIGHLNWEMRNVYKEWMFKYYVLGQLSNPKSYTATVSGGGDGVDFRLKKFDAAGTSQGDRYNLPSVCVHFPSTTNVCAVYQIPGLPRFKVTALANVSEYFEAAVDNFAQTKARNCSDRSNYNFAAAMSYAYSTGSVSMQDIPIVVAHRTGAWIKSMELAFRMRNLEYIMNRPPISEICEAGCSNTRSGLINEESSTGLGLNERPIKAFTAALKSLSGGRFKNYMGASLKIREISPKPYTTSDNRLSGFLIPGTSTYPINGGGSPLTKYYLDLVPLIANYATFFTTFASRSGNLAELGIPEAGSVTTEASCASTKTALPVPGYILGFMKNPQILTYYALKGEAPYQGLLNPFGTINLHAYAAAKPYGGRIGPALLKPSGGGSGSESPEWINLTSRSSDSGFSANYLLSFSTAGDPRVADNTDPAGLPIPSTSDFYIDGYNAVVGGIPGQSQEVKFAIPNLIYKLPTPTVASNSIPSNVYYPTTTTPIREEEKVGLFDKLQYLAFRAPVSPLNEQAGTMSAADIELAIETVKSPTNYDMANYLIPTVEGLGDDTENIETLKPFRTSPITGTPVYAIYAPLYGEATLYRNQESIKSILNNYINGPLRQSIEKYIESLRDAATAIRTPNPSRGHPGYPEAANSIHEDSTQPASFPPADCETVSIAAKFNFFLFGQELVATPANCNILPLMASLSEYLFNLGQNPETANYHLFTLKFDQNLTNSQLATAYMPGAMQGATQNAQFNNPIVQNSDPINLKRNFYSTKFVQMRSLLEGENPSYISSSISNLIFLEKGENSNTYSSQPVEDFKYRVLNSIDTTGLELFLNDLRF